MKNRKVFISIIFVTLAILLFTCDYSDKDSFSSEVDVESSKESVDEIIEIKPKLVEASVNSSTVKDQSAWDFCQQTIYNHYEISKCESDCHSHKLKNLDTGFHNFVSSGWGRKSLSEIKLDQLKLDTRYQKFLVALAYSDLLEERESYNFERSETLLKELALEDPSNSYVYYFYAYALFKNNKRSMAKLILDKAKSVPGFVSYMNLITIKNHKVSLRSPALYLLANELYPLLPYPNLDKLIEVLDLNVDSLEDLANKLVRAGLKSSGKDANRITWDIVSYVTGVRLFRKLGLKEALVLPRFDEIIVRNNGSRFSEIHIDAEECVSSFETVFEDALLDYRRNPPK